MLIMLDFTKELLVRCITEFLKGWEVWLIANNAVHFRLKQRPVSVMEPFRVLLFPCTYHGWSTLECRYMHTKRLHTMPV